MAPDVPPESAQEMHNAESEIVLEIARCVELSLVVAEQKIQDIQKIQNNLLPDQLDDNYLADQLPSVFENALSKYNSLASHYENSIFTSKKVELVKKLYLLTYATYIFKIQF
eukprot:GHVP01020429.1.p1 GENE.GHVP01020429.1~~GHVP01020429.1.p1  ORF type:complete len:112 (-),score=19.98 GHVP01020429.1:258-593(-)